MKKNKAYLEYMASLTEQIHDMRAKRLVEAEIENHIEEQTECYEAEGMCREEAIKEAVRQMGNPVETGIELNRIHKPKIPWVMLGLVIVMMLMAIVIQAVIFIEGGIAISGWASLPKAIVYHVISLCVILCLLYFDYNFIARHAYRLYAAYLVGIPVFKIIVMSLYGKVTASSAYYGVQMLFPIIVAGIIYCNRNRGLRGVVESLLLGACGAIWCSTILGAGGNDYRYSALAETLLVIATMVGVAFYKNVFGWDKRKSGIVIGTIAIFFVIAIVLFFIIGGWTQSYMWKRLANAVTGGESGYINLAVRDSIAQADWLGGGTFLLGEVNSESYGIFALNTVFTYFGKLAGVIVIAVYLGFLLMALYMSLKQNNRMGMLVGTACTISILVRFIAYLACNFGFGVWWTTLVPFLSYGSIGAVMNGIYIGLILCVYRNSRILSEEKVKRKEIKQIRIIVE